MLIKNLNISHLGTQDVVGVRLDAGGGGSMGLPSGSLRLTWNVSTLKFKEFLTWACLHCSKPHGLLRATEGVSRKFDFPSTRSPLVVRWSCRLLLFTRSPVVMAPSIQWYFPYMVSVCSQMVFQIWSPMAMLFTITR